jgi:murein DD-endopeptidase MepM/ murein hydrolase activator NlpD
MIKDRYYVKIVPHEGETVHRFEVHRQHIIGALLAVAIVLFGVFSVMAFQSVRAHAQVSELRAQAASQQATLKTIDRQTDALRRALQHVQKQNQEIRKLIGAPTSTPAPIQKTSWQRGQSFPDAEERLHALSAASMVTTRESDSIRRFAMHVLNIRHLRDLARAQLIAAIPSIDPVDGAEVVGCFCYRTSPDVEFHKGVDLGADYGETVRAAAAGTVASAGWDDGGYGIKVDIDHGNGYHTWYAHLSRADVHAGERVYKGEAIAAVGSTGFSTGPHLHYQLMLNGTPIDPTPFLHGVPANVLASLP